MNYKYNNMNIYIIAVILLSAIVQVGIINKIEILYPVLMWIPGLVAIIVNVISIITNKEKISLKTFINRLGFRKTIILSQSCISLTKILAVKYESGSSLKA